MFSLFCDRIRCIGEDLARAGVSLNVPSKPDEDDSIQPRRIALLGRFIIMGILGTLVYFGLAVGLSALSVGISIAHWIAYAVSQAVSYFGQKKFTFRVQGRHARSASRYLVAMVILATVHYLVVLGLDALKFPATLVFVGTSAFYPPASWLIHTYWTFRLPDRGHETSA